MMSVSPPLLFMLMLDASWAGIVVAIIGGGVTWAVASLVWAIRQSARIDLTNSEILRLSDRIASCEDKADEMQTASKQLDDRLRSIDSKLSRLMGRLGMPVRAEDFETEGT